MKQQITQRQNTRLSLLKRIFIICKMQHFLFLKHSNTYLHVYSLLQVLFCYPFYILYPHKLFQITLGRTRIKLPQNRITKRTKFRNILHKGIIGASFGFLFWLPFWWFIVANVLSVLLYRILFTLFACFIIYCCIIFISIRVVKEADNSVLCNMPIRFSKTYFNSTILPYFILFLIICIGIFSLLHDNSYVGVSLCYPLSIAIFVFIPRIYRFWFGFFVGVFGFYWIALSFRFQDLDIAIPFAIVAIGLIYGILFWFLCYFQNLVFRFVAMLLLFVIHPLDFNWLNIVYFSSYSVFEASMLSMLCVSFALYVIVANNTLYWLAPILLLIAFDYNMQIQKPKLHAKIIETTYSQDMRWLPNNQEYIIENNLLEINNAIKEGYSLVILPETAFPFALNLETDVYNKLLELSHHITIATGAIRIQDSNITHPTNLKQSKKQTQTFTLDKPPNIETIQKERYINKPNMKAGYYNTTYIFSKGFVLVADKNVLVPFGETLPFNDFLSPVFEWFFGDTFGFNSGNGLVSFILQGFHIAIANCYEGTMDLPYTTGAKYILMLSNNAWFSPSTQHFMQQMIAKYYARNYQVFIYHSTNYTPKAIITPNNGKD